MVLDLGRKTPLKRAGRGFRTSFQHLWVPQHTVVPRVGVMGNTACVGVWQRMLRRRVSTRTSLGYGKGSSVLWQDVWGVFGCVMGSQQFAWPCMPSCHVPLGRGRPLCSLLCRTHALWLLRGLFLN